MKPKDLFYPFLKRTALLSWVLKLINIPVTVFIARLTSNVVSKATDGDIAAVVTAGVTLLSLVLGYFTVYSSIMKDVSYIIRKQPLMDNAALLDPSAAAAWREQFAYAAQNPYLFGISVRENVHLGNLKASADEVDDILKQLGLDHLADRTVSLSQTELSGGEKQKISIGRALLKKTPILLLDEPSNHLDTDAVEWLADWLRSSPQTILYISHDPTLMELADQKIQL